MTEQKAIEEIKTIPLIRLKQKHCDALEMSIVALEKQIPKKMLQKPHTHIDITLMYTCPTCKTEYNRFYENKKYCMECGQKLDWSD